MPTKIEKKYTVNDIKQYINDSLINVFDEEESHLTTKSDFNAIKSFEPEIKSTMIFKKIEDFKIESTVEENEDKIKFEPENTIKIKIIQNYISKQKFYFFKISKEKFKSAKIDYKKIFIILDGTVILNQNRIQGRFLDIIKKKETFILKSDHFRKK